MKTLKPKQILLFTKFHTTPRKLNLNKELILNKIKVNASEILLYNKSMKLKNPESSKIVFQKMKETSFLYQQIYDFENSKKFLDRVIEMTKSNSGEKHVNLIELYYHNARNNLFLNHYEEGYNDIFEIILIKNSVKELELENISLDTTEDEKLLHLFLFYTSYFQNVHLNEEAKAKLHVNDPTKSLQQILESFPVQKRFNAAKEVLEVKLKEINMDDSENLKENFQLHILTCRKLASLHEAKGFQKEASEYYRSAYKYSVELYGRSSPLSALILVDLSETIMEINKFESRDFAKEAIVIFSRVPKETLVENPHYEVKIAKAMKILGQIYLHLKPEESYTYFKNASVIFEKIEGRENINWIDTSYSFLHSLDILDKRREADFLKKDIEDVIFKFKSDDEIMAVYYENFGIHYLRNDQLIFAEQFFVKAKNLYENLGNILKGANMEMNIALILHKRGELERSEKMLVQCYENLAKQNLTQDGIAKKLASWNELLGDDIANQMSTMTDLDKINLNYLREFKLENFQKGKLFSTEREENEAFDEYLSKKTSKDKKYQELMEKYEPTNSEYELLVEHARKILSDKNEVDRVLNELKNDPDILKLLVKDDVDNEQAKFMENLEAKRQAIANMTKDIVSNRVKKHMAKKKKPKSKK